MIAQHAVQTEADLAPLLSVELQPLPLQGPAQTNSLQHLQRGQGEHGSAGATGTLPLAGPAEHAALFHTKKGLSANGAAAQAALQKVRGIAEKRHAFQTKEQRHQRACPCLAVQEDKALLHETKGIPCRLHGHGGTVQELETVDGKPLAESDRIVLVYSTEMVNSGMILSGSRASLIKFGIAPALMRTGTLELSLRNAGSGMVLYALAVDGTRVERLPLDPAVDGRLSIRIDTSKLAKGPTPFFELVRE